MRTTLLVMAVATLALFAGCESKCQSVGWDGSLGSCNVWWECDDGFFEADCNGADGAACTCAQDGVSTPVDGVVGFCAGTEALEYAEQGSGSREDIEAELVDVANQMCGWSVEPAM